MWPALGTVDGNCQHQTPEGPGPDPGQLRPPFPLLKDPPRPPPSPRAALLDGEVRQPGDLQLNSSRLL